MRGLLSKKENADKTYVYDTTRVPEINKDKSTNKDKMWY